MALDEFISLRMPSEDLPLIEKVVHYRAVQGLLKRPTLSEYIRYLMNRDISEAVAEIEKRRK